MRHITSTISAKGRGHSFLFESSSRKYTISRAGTACHVCRDGAILFVRTLLDLSGRVLLPERPGGSAWRNRHHEQSHSKCRCCKRWAVHVSLQAAQFGEQFQCLAGRNWFCGRLICAFGPRVFNKLHSVWLGGETACIQRPCWDDGHHFDFRRQAGEWVSRQWQYVTCGRCRLVTPAH